MATGKSDAASATPVALAWVIACIAVGVAVVHAYPGAYVQDPALHFLRARWMWSHPWMLVDVWDRPLFTLAYAIPAALPGSGTPYLVAKFATVGLTAATAWLTWDVARGYRLERAALAIPLLWLQPCVFLLCAETTPEPLFALLFALALLLYQRGRLVQSALVVSLLILVRPEGIALAAVWAWCTIRDTRAGQTGAKRVATASALVVAPVVWWYLAAQITQDPWFIVHNWPSLSASWASILTGGGIENPLRQWAQIVGAVLAAPFVVGLAVSVRRRQLGMPVAAILAVTVAHLLVGGAGVFGWAPVPSAFMCVAPALALITLSGWNALSALQEWVPFGGRRAVGWCVMSAVLLVSLLGDVLVADSQIAARDWRPISAITSWFSDHPRPIRRLIWSSAYADVLFGHDPMESALTYGDRDKVMAMVSASPPGTLVVWDSDIGPSWYHVTGDQIARLGYITLQHEAFSEGGRIPTSVEALPGIAGYRRLLGLDPPHPRTQDLWLLYRP
jgi:hypothetical protein